MTGDVLVHCSAIQQKGPQATEGGVRAHQHAQGLGHAKLVVIAT